jgi:hypothetical protein
MNSYRQLPGLPAYGPVALAFPASWGRLGREGMVVEFARPDGKSWVGNFAPGFEGLSTVLPHPDGRRVLVFARGHAWAIDVDAKSGEEVMGAVAAVWTLKDSDSLVLSRQGLAFARLGPTGIVWHTRQLSWDGFDKVRVDSRTISGMAWDAVNDCWRAFEVDLRTGAATGGSFGAEDTMQWERLAPTHLPPNEH